MRRTAHLLLLGLLAASAAVADEAVTVGSKNFTESYILAEMFAQALEADGIEVRRRFGFGGTRIAYEALVGGEIDVYPEYTGTIREALLSEAQRELPVPEAVAQLGLRLLPPLGFNNSYALAVSEDFARRHRLGKISDLARVPGVRAAFSHEFLERPDGWRALANAYQLDIPASGVEHALAYRALADGAIDLTDAYTTDGELAAWPVHLLTDDRGFFPRYDAVPLARAGLPRRAVAALARLGGSLPDATMRRLNAAVVNDGRKPAEAAAAHLADARIAVPAGVNGDSFAARLGRNTARHLLLTGTALVLATLAGIGIGIAVFRAPRVARAALQASGLLQTIPSIALLALLIPLTGVGVLPAIIALFLYSLLPVLRNTVTALTTVEPVYTEVAEAMGMSQAQQMRHVYLPLAAPHVLAGIRTAAVISIGTATLAAFIGAGGLGDPIVTGLALNDTALILEGAVPAALLAILTELGFVRLEARLVPAHLRAA